MDESIPTRFRVVIVGAGPVGLYLAHALSRANIDYIILEQHDTVIRYQGAGVLVFPQTLRLLDQLGIYGEVKKDLITAHTLTDLLTLDGRVIKSAPLWAVLEERHAYPMAGLSRAQLIALLYENLPEKETRVKTGASVIDVEAHDKGVRVHLKDGGTEEGSILIGIDGVYSKTRQIMQQKLARSLPDAWPMTATYQGLYGCFHSSIGLEPGTFYQSRGTGIVSQVTVGEDRGYFALLRPNTPAIQSRRYTTEDRDRLANELKDVFVAPGVCFGDMWEHTDKETSAMVNQEEGYCDKWYHERVALAGDAVHKITSASGMGVNAGIDSATVLANELHRLLQADAAPSTKAIEDAFARYQNIRDPSARRLQSFGRKHIRSITWETWGNWIFDRFVNPWIGVERVAGIIGEGIKRGHILEYVPFKDREVRVPWTHSPAA